MSRARRFLLLFGLLLVIVGANGYGAVVLATFNSPTVSATLTDCHHRNGCVGTWTGPDGREQSGRIAGVVSSREGREVDIHIGPLGAYSATPSTKWIRMIVPLVADTAVIGVVAVTGYVIIRGRVAASRIAADAAPGTGIYRVRRRSVSHGDGRAHMSITRSGGFTVDLDSPQGLPWCRIRKDEADSVTISRPDGTLLARLRRYTNTSEPIFTVSLTDTAGESLAAMDMAGLGSQTHRMVATDGRLLGSIVVTGLHGALVRVEPRTGDHERLLLIGTATVASRITNLTDATR